MIWPKQTDRIILFLKILKKRQNPLNFCIIKNITFFEKHFALNKTIDKKHQSGNSINLVVSYLSIWIDR